MSVVAAKVYDDKIIIAADSIATNMWSKDTKSGKLFKENDVIVGGVGACKDISIMKHYIKTHRPLSPSEKDVLEFYVEFRKYANDFNASDDTVSFLLAFDGHLFQIENYWVREITDYIAIGAGQDYANAALYLKHSPKEAVSVACHLCCYVCEPIIEYQMERH